MVLCADAASAAPMTISDRNRLIRLRSQCPDSEVRKHSPRPLSELRNRKDTSNIMILVPLLNPKFATVPAAISCELRVRGTSACSGEVDAGPPTRTCANQCSLGRGEIRQRRDVLVARAGDRGAHRRVG